MLGSNRIIGQTLFWTIALAIVVGIPAEIFLLGSNYLSEAVMLVVGAVYVSVLFRYARTRRLPAAEGAPNPILPAESSVSRPSYQLRIHRTEPAQLRIVCEARLGLRAGLIALCPGGFLVAGPAAVIWAAVVEPPVSWAYYPAILALLAFLIWLGLAFMATNLLQNVWGETHLAFAGERLIWQITWRGRVWLDRSYRIGPAASVRNDLSNWLGVRIRGLEPEGSSTWWTRPLFVGPADAVNFGAALSLADAQLAAAYIQQHLRFARCHFQEDVLAAGAGI